MKYIYITALSFLAFAASAAVQPADFENLTLAPESCWIGDAATPATTFKSGSFTFANSYNPEWGSWAFFGYANFTGNSYPGGYSPEAQTMNGVGGGYNSSNYGICYCDFFNPDPEVVLDEAAVVPGMYITNTAWVVDAIVNGDGMSPAFGQGDYLKVTITGKKSDGSTTSLDYYLADYRSEDATEHYYVSDWRYLDLSSLGEIVSYTSKMTTTKNNEWGATTPLFYAFDNLGAEASGVEEVVEDFDVKVSVAEGVATIKCNEESFEAAAYTLDGLAVFGESACGVLTLQLPGKGLNVVRIVTVKGVKVLKLKN